MIAITKWTMKQRKWSIFWWAFGVSALIFITLIFYPTIRNQTSQLDQSFNQLPESARALFTDTQDLFSPVGYLSSQLFYLMLPMVLAILAIGLGSSLIAKEESEGTLELLLSRPISRGRLLAEKALAGLGIVALVGAVAMAVTVLMCWAINMDVGLGNVAIASVYSIVLAVVFGAVAFFVASWGRSGRLASVGVAALLGLGGYIVSSLSQIVSWLKWPAKFLPNHYYQPGDILHGQYSWWPLLAYAAVILALGFLSYISFRRRDILGG